MINPFDKLNQKQFDSYVSNIQAKIKVALDPPSPEPQHVSRTFAEISRSTIASPAPSPAPLSKHPSQEARPSSRATYTPIGAGTPNEPYELSDDDDDEADEPAEETQITGSRSGSEVPAEDELPPLSAIQEGSDEGEDESGADDAQDTAYEVGNRHNPHDEDAWPYSGEDASEDDDEPSGAEEVEEEEEDVFVGKGKGRHPAEGPGLAGLLNGSGAHRASGAPESPERASRSLRSPDNSFEAGVARMPTWGTTSTPFIPRAARRGPSPEEDSEDDDDTASPPWEAEQGISMPALAAEQENTDGEEESEDEHGSAGAGHDNAIEVLDSDEESTSNKMEVDQIPASRSAPGVLDNLYAGLDNTEGQSEIDELQFDDLSAFPNQGHEPDSLLDDTMEGDGSVELPSIVGTYLPKSSSLFTGSTASTTREPSQSKDIEGIEELDHSTDTVQAPEYSVEEPDLAVQPPVEPGVELELDQPSIQQSMDYSDFLGEHSMLNQQPDTSLTRTQAEEHLMEVTVYELENGSRYYDYEGTRHFINPEGEVYETCPIPPPKPTIQRPPDLSMIEEVTECDMTRRTVDQDEDETPDQFDFLKGLDDTFASVGAPVLRYPNENDSNSTFNMDDIPQRPGAAMGFRAREPFDEDSSAFLSESAVMADDIVSASGVGRQTQSLSRNHSITGILEESMTGRNAGDLISEADDLISEEDGDAGADADSIDSILDDEDDSQDRSGVSTLANREDLVTPVPPPLKDEVQDMAHNVQVNHSQVQELPELDEKSVADALAAVAQLAEATAFDEMMNAGGGVQDASANALADPNPSAFDGDSQQLDNLMNAVTNMSQVEEDILARSFNMADALQSTTVPLGQFDEIPDTVLSVPIGWSQESVAASNLGEMAQNPYAEPMISDAPEKLPSEVLAEVFEGVDPVIFPSGAATGTATPYEPLVREVEPSAHEDVEVYSRCSTPKPSGATTTDGQDASPRRTPPTPTLSVGQSPTAPEQSIATSISGVQQNVSIYETSSASSTHDDAVHSIPPEPEATQLPDPNLPPAPTHLRMPAVPNEAPGARREISPSVMVEPPTPHTRSEDGTIDTGAQGSKPKVDETDSTSNEHTALEQVDPATKSDEDDDVDVDGLLSEAEDVHASEPQNAAENDTDSSRQTSEPRATPTPPEKIQAGDKRKRLLDEVQSPTPQERTSLQSARNTPSRLSEGLVKSPPNDSVPLPNSPVARNYQSLFKRTPTSGPLSTASGTSSRKTSGSDHGAPAPWPMRHRTHQHARPAGASPAHKSATSVTGSPMTRSNCRFHKVTIPVDDIDDAKVEFIVPACALGNRETLQEQGIEDCGPSTPEEENNLVTNLDDLEPSIVNKLTILVGTSLLNEGVCGYIDKPSVPKAPRSAPTRSKSLKGSLSRSSVDFKADSPGTDKEGRSLSPRAKPKLRSRPSIRHDDRLYKPPAESESDESMEDEPTRKRSKRRATGATTSSVKFPTLGPESPQKPVDPASSQPTGAQVTISKRMKRARRPADAQPFKPDPKEQESSTDAESGRSPRKRTRRQNTGTARRSKSKTPMQDHRQTLDEDTNPFKPKHELKRVLSPKAANKVAPQPSISAALTEPSEVEQKELERHLALGDNPGEVVDEGGESVDTKQLEPAPAMAAAHVDRSAHNEMGQKESNGTGTSSGAKSVTKKGWHKFFPF